jgi:hypothetical protein
MKNRSVVFPHIRATSAKVLPPDGTRALVSDNFLLTQQLLVTERLAGAIRREFPDRTLFSNKRDPRSWRSFGITTTPTGFTRRRT